MTLLSEKVKELTNEQIISAVPSIGAVNPYCNVSEKYSFIPTISAVNHLRDSGWIPVMAAQASVRIQEKNGFQKHMIRFTRPDLVVNGHRMDLLLYNSHDRGCAFKLIGGVFRFVCSNGMVIGDKVAEYSHKHMGFNPDMFINSALLVGEHIEKTAGVIEDWQTVKMEKNEQGVFVKAAHQLIYEDPEKAPIQPNQLLSFRRSEDREKNDLWSTLNTVQENMIKGGLRGRSANGKKTRTKGINSIDKDRRLNQALWVLTEEMAKLKK